MTFNVSPRLFSASLHCPTSLEYVTIEYNSLMDAWLSVIAAIISYVWGLDYAAAIERFPVYSVLPLGIH